MTWRASTHIHTAVVSDCGSLPDQPCHLTSFPQFPHLWCGGIGYLSHSVAAGTKLDVRRKASVWSTVCARHVNVRVWSTEKTFRMTSKFQGAPLPPRFPRVDTGSFKHPSPDLWGADDHIRWCFMKVAWLFSVSFGDLESFVPDTFDLSGF